MFNSVAGGFEVSASDRIILAQQRAITKLVNERFVQVGATFLKMSGKDPFDEDWYNRNRGDTDLQSWVDSESHFNHNVGFNLQLGWMDVDIDASDPKYNRCILEAMDYLSIDTRLRFGRREAGFPTHLLLQLGEDESENFEELHKFEPKPFRLKGKNYHVQLRSYPTKLQAANVEKKAKQTVMPGSIYTSKKTEGAYDLSVWYDKSGALAPNVAQLIATTPRRVNFNEVVRAIAFGTFLYLMRDHWVEGQRQATAVKVSGWLARLVSESQAINNHESIASDVFCPIDTDDIAEHLLRFACQGLGDEETPMRVRAYRDARDKLNRNPDAQIPGWPSMEQLFGGEVVIALRSVLMPGSDVSELTKMAERYIYDETDNSYIDRRRFKTVNGKFAHEGAELERRHRGDTIRIGGKPREAFKVFESSDIRKRVDFRDFYPELSPGGIYRLDAMARVVPDEVESEEAYVAFNTWRGWAINPVDKPDPEVLAKCNEYLDQLLKYLTRDNPDQMRWIKQWIAWIRQRPAEKQQIAWVCVGDQGVGKSFMGNIFLKAIIGPALWGTASPKIMEGDFNIGPFKEKMVVFVDEAKFHHESGTDEVKKLIRNVNIPGMEKYQDGRNYNIYARLMFASNRFDMNIGQANTRDRALFYTRTYDKSHLGLSETEFRAWAETLKPWFTEFSNMLDDRNIIEHFLYIFHNMPCTKQEVESIKFSSSDDADIVMSNMSWPRRVAKYIIETARIYEDIDILYPFTVPDLNNRITEVCRELNLKNVAAARVLTDFEDAGLIEKVSLDGKKKLKFRHRYADLVKQYEHFIGVPLEPNYEFTEDDYGLNDKVFTVPPAWRGKDASIFGNRKY